MTEEYGPLLSRDQVIELLRELGEDLASRGVEAQIFVVGGAAMALAFNTRRLTHDVAGVFEPKVLVYEAARRVAANHDGLQENWLNDAVKGLLPGRDPGARVILDQPGVAVSVPSARYLLALKVQAARIDRDEDDIRFLARECGASTADEILSIVAEVLGQHRLLEKSQFIVQEMFPPARLSLTERIAQWREERRLSASTKPPARTPLPKSPKPPRCPGRTKAGKRSVLRAGHKGNHRGR